MRSAEGETMGIGRLPHETSPTGCVGVVGKIKF
jgi:hypothetical protein